MTTSEGSTGPNGAGWRRYKPLVGAVPAVLVILVSLWEVVCVARAGRDVPGDDAWQRASESVREQFQPGDLIVFAPAWNDPVGRLHLGDLIDIDTAARMDAARFATIWELSIRGARAKDTRGLDAVSSESFGGVRVRKYEQEPAVVLTDFLTAPQSKGRRDVRLEEVGFEPHRCIRVSVKNTTVDVEYADVELGSTLVGYVGFADVFTRRDERQPGTLEVTVPGTDTKRVEFGVNDGWKRFEIDTTAAAKASVTFSATAPAHEKNRLICFAAEARQ